MIAARSLMSRALMRTFSGEQRGARQLSTRYPDSVRGPAVLLVQMATALANLSPPYRRRQKVKKTIKSVAPL